MASAVTDLETGLQAMLNLKPPGVSGSRITSLTSLCVANIQSESVLIQKIYTHFKKTPGTHKLGVLYVVDSVTRKWLEQAKAQGQPINSSASDGTYAAGVHRVTELMPVLMNDITQSAPEDQKEKIKKLLDIWEKGQTFPTSMLASFRQGLSSPSQAKTSTTPPGSPPPNVLASLQGRQPTSTAAPASTTANGSSILEALANIARQNTTSSAAPSNGNLPVPAASYSMPASALPQPVSSSQAPSSYSAASQPVNMPFSLAQMLGQNVPAQGMPANTVPQMPAAPGVAPGGMDPNTQQQIMLIKLLADQGVPFDKIPALIQSMTGGAAVGQPTPAPAPAPAVQGSFPVQPAWGAPSNGPSREDPRNRAYGDGGRSPNRFHNGRSRSRSPDRWGQRGSPRGGRDFGGRNSPPRGRHEDRDRNARRGNDFRQRSPPGGRRGRSPSSSGELPHVDRWIEFDQSLLPNSIRVLSRTLFVGGVTCPEPELRAIFGRYGTVQTCIVNKDKRHAFVKMLTRKDAESAKTNMEDNRHLDIPLRTRWGVGFGPRDCSDYATGVSIIPIPKLTEADRKWMLTAPYGGSGGRPIEAGLCVEEPDIEIGAGVSSKAISRRMQTDKGGQNGPKSTRQRDDDWSQDDNGSHGRGGRGSSDRGTGANHGQGGQMPGFPFGVGTLPNGMPNFPQGFQFPQ